MISKRNTLKTLTALAVAATFAPGLAMAQVQNDGSANKPLRVVLIPADGGTEDGTKKDFQPVFSAITQATGINFDIKVGQSYSAAVEAMCSGAADIAFYGPATYLQAKARNCAELLALAVRGGGSVYYSGIFARKDANVNSITDIKGKRIALGDVNSTSSFNVPVAMMMQGGVKPWLDAKTVNMAGSHANVLNALNEGLSDVGGASFDSFEKAVNAKAIDQQGSRAAGAVRARGISHLETLPSCCLRLYRRARGGANPGVPACAPSRPVPPCDSLVANRFQWLRKS